MTEPSINLLGVSLAFPPLAYPRSIQVARLLADTDASTALFCASEPDVRIDTTIEPQAEERLAKCFRVPVPNGNAGQYIDRFTHKFARSIWNRRNLVPDRYGRWRNDVLKAISGFLEKDEFKPDVIVTFAQPFSGHLIGLELKSRLRLPWLAHFSDPWADNPFMPFDDSAKKANLKLERMVAENADVLAFTSQETIDLFYAKYPAPLSSKARLLPQSFDPHIFGNGKRPQLDKITIRYIGNFYGNRTPRPLISALIEINRRSPELLQNVAFELIGSGDADEVRRLSSELPSALITTRSSVPYRESLDLMMSADGLLVIDAPADKSVFLPSKLIDYIGAGRPVLGITPEGAAASLIRELGGTVAHPAEPEQMSRMLERFFRNLNDRRHSKDNVNWGPDEVRARYTAKTVAGQFLEMLKELTYLRM